MQHRLGGPSLELFNQDGATTLREWYMNGVLHRADGPAKEYFSRDGRRTNAAYYLGGMPVPKVEYHRRAALLKLSVKKNTDREVSL